MSVFSFNQILSLYIWFPLAALLLIYLLIARFYERFSHRRMYFWLYAIPIVCYGAAAVRYASVNQITGDMWGDLLGAAGGVVLVILSTHTFLTMMSPRDG